MVYTRRPGERGSGGYRTRRLTTLVKLWTGSVRRERRQHNFALFHRIFRSQSSSRPSQVRIVGKSSNVDIDQPAFVIHRKGIPADYCAGRRRRLGSLSSYQHPIRRGETGYRCGINRIGGTRSRNQVMTVPTSQTDRTAICRGISRTNSGSPTRCSISRAVANQIGIVVRNPSRVARWLNIIGRGRCRRRVSENFLLKIAHRDVERATGQ